MDLDDNMFRDLCENANDLIQSVSPDGRFLYVNRAWLHTLGYTQGEVGDLHVFDIIHQDSRAHCERLLTELMSGCRSVQIQADFRSKDGRRIPVEGSASCRFENGQPAATRGIFRDIRDRRKAEADLDRLFTMSLDMMCIAGLDGYFKRINPAFERILGYSKDELLSHSFLEYVHPEDRLKTIGAIERLSKGLPVVDFQNRYMAKEGKYLWLAWRSAPVQPEGLVYAVARDITEQKRLHQAMARQSKELARSNADLEQFAYIASHDLRAPLRAMGSLADWIEEDAPKPLPERMREHLDKLRRRVTRMETLTDDLLEYSRAGRRPGEITEVDSAAMVDEVTDFLSPPQELVVSVDPGMPTLVTAKSALEQVFRNLVGNAIKHHPGPKGRIEVSCREKGRFYEFSVSDDGDGIPEVQREKIFHMFQTLKAHPGVEGTGIGLALVKRLVEAHGGRVWASSGKEGGAVFAFTWPRRIESQEDGDADSSDR